MRNKEEPQPDLSDLWACPRCQLDTGSPHKTCPCCGTYLLLLARIKIEAACLWQSGLHQESNTLLTRAKNKF